MASITQSVGVPSTCQPSRPPRLHRAQRMVERERVARRALLAVRRDDGHLAERVRRGDETLEAAREDAVVVGDEKTHQAVVSPRGRESSTDTSSRRSDSTDSTVSMASAVRAIGLSSPF